MAINGGGGNTISSQIATIVEQQNSLGKIGKRIVRYGRDDNAQELDDQRDYADDFDFDLECFTNRKRRRS